MRSPAYIAALTGSNLETSAIGQVTGGLIKPLGEDSAVMLALIRSTYRNDQIARQQAGCLGYCRDLLDAVAIGQYPHWT